MATSTVTILGARSVAVFKAPAATSTVSMPSARRGTVLAPVYISTTTSGLLSEASDAISTEASDHLVTES